MIVFLFVVFIRSPDPLNVTVGATAEFFCRAEGDIVSWAVNSTSLSTLNDTNINSVDGPIIDGIRTEILRIMTGVQHNNTVIQCRSVTITPEDVVLNESTPALLMVQGKYIVIHSAGRKMLIKCPIMGMPYFLIYIK